MKHSPYDVDTLIIGGGIIGLATAYRLTQTNPEASLTVLEKEDQLGMHQTGHNSGVLHSGIYYKPGSLKALNCREGKGEMEQFCRDENIPYEICGKVIVAVSPEEIPALENIYKRGQENGVRCEMIDSARLHELEPHVQGVRAIHVPEAGIVDYVKVCERLSEKIQKHPGKFIMHHTQVQEIQQKETKAGRDIRLETTSGVFEANSVVNCAGLYSDRVAKLGGDTPEAQIVPFRGEYYKLNEDKKYLCQNLIYPVPNPAFPFLGVHLTRSIEGNIECGPNAVLAFAREGYTKTQVNLPELFETLSYSGFLKLASKYWRAGLGELWRSYNKKAFVQALQRLVPELQAADLEVAPAGIRAQTLLPDGNMVDDFLIRKHKNIINVCNAPSPAATSSLTIGKSIAELLP